MAALSFIYAPPVSKHYIPFVESDESSTLINLTNQCQLVATNRECQITVQTVKSKKLQFNLTLTGSLQSIMLARGDLLQQCPLEIQLTIDIPPTFQYAVIQEALQTIQQEFNVTIQIVPGIKHHSSLISDNTISIHIIGMPIHVERCRIKVLTRFDEIMKNHTTDNITLPLKLQYLICGRKRVNLLPIIEETCTNIYFPSPFTHLLDHDELPIHITGEPNQVTRVKDMLNKLTVQKAKSMYHKDTALYARKIDWLLLHKRDELRKIMHDNGAFIRFPPMGSGDNVVTIYAENRVNAERTLRALNFQACQIYEACFFFNVKEPSSFFDAVANVSQLVSELSQISASEVIYKSDPGCVEVLGSERAIRNVYQRLQEIQFIQVYHEYTMFRVESSNEQRDFISGKKNGKINKIMKTSGAKIRFMPYINDYNFIIEVESTSFAKALDGLTLLQEELPAEISFYVPESYHKRIIGVGGKNIQRIMKKYGVYVKFSNTEEFASLGGYYNNQDNVVARTPMKNQINLDNLRHSVMELIHSKDRNYITQTTYIPFSLHSNLIYKYQDSFISEEVLKKTNTQVIWPDVELASSLVELLGPEAHIPVAISMLETIIPEPYDLHFPCSESDFKEIISDAFRKEVADVLSEEYGIVVEVNHQDGDGCIRLSILRDQIKHVLKEGLDIAIRFLTSKNIGLYEGTSADALYAVAEKSLDTKANPPFTHPFMETSHLLKQISPSASTSTPNTSSAPLMTDTIYKSSSTTLLHNNTLFHNWNPMHPSSSSGDIRAIFDAPEQRYQRMSMPSTFGFPPPTSASTPDIWSSPIGSRNRRSAPGFSTRQQRQQQQQQQQYPSRNKLEANGAPAGIFYNEFNPYRENPYPNTNFSNFGSSFLEDVLDNLHQEDTN